MKTIDKIDLFDKISANKINQVFHSLSDIISDGTRWEPYNDRLVLIRNRYKANEFRSRSNLIGVQEEFLNRNNIIYDLIQLIRDLPSEIIRGDIPNEVYPLFKEPSLKKRFFSILIDHIGLAITALILINLFFIVVSDSFIEVKFSIFLALIITLHQTKDIIYGKSFGKRITGLCVKDINTGKDANEIFSFIRNLTIIVFPLELFFMVLAQLTSRRLGDVIANTIVVENATQKPLFKSFKEDFRRYSFTKEMMIAVGIAFITTAITSLIIWYILIFEVKYQF